jgi:hypothetical protein
MLRILILIYCIKKNIILSQNSPDHPLSHKQRHLPFVSNTDAPLFEQTYFVLHAFCLFNLK